MERHLLSNAASGPLTKGGKFHFPSCSVCRSPDPRQDFTPWMLFGWRSAPETAFAPNTNIQLERMEGAAGISHSERFTGSQANSRAGSYESWFSSRIAVALSSGTGHGW